MKATSNLIKFTNLSAEGGNVITFDVHNLDLAVVNALRRTILSDIPNVCMQFNPYDPDKNRVVVTRNTSAIHNEMLGHRMSMIPVCLTENEVFEVLSNPSKFRFTLNEKNITPQVINITTKSIVVYENGVKSNEAKREAIFPANPISKDNVLIVKLRPSPLNLKEGEEISLEASLAIGTAKSHACFCPVSICYFTNTCDQAKAERAFKENIKAENDSRSASKLASLTEQEIYIMKQEFDCLESKRHFFTNDAGDPCQFTFFIESECRMRPQYLVMKAFMVLHDKVENLKVAVETGVDDVITIHPFGNIPGLYQVNILHEGHTVGNLLQALLFNKYIRDVDASKRPIEFVGYHQPHPLEDYVFLKIKLSTSDSSGGEGKLRQLLENALHWMSEALAALAIQWYTDAKAHALKVIELDNFVSLHEKTSKQVDLKNIGCRGAITTKAQIVDTAPS